jgi:LemA protein
MSVAQTILAVLLVAGLVALAYLIMTYNGLVAVKNNVALAWANIDVLLKQRHDELPKLVAVCKNYKEFEQATLTRVTEARSRVAAARESQNIGALGPAEGALRSGVAQIFAVAERYPDLKANANFMQLQARITGLENAIADRREYYNESVNVNNVRIEQFPDVIVARAFKFGEKRLLEFDARETADVDVGAMFKPAA